MRIAVIVLMTLALTGCVVNFGCANFKAHKQMELSCEAGKAFDASTVNGGIEVTAGEGPCKVIADIEAGAPSQQEADELISKVTVRLERHGDVVKAVIDQPIEMHNRYVGVSYKISVPAGNDLRLSTVNGAIGVSAMKGSIAANTVNGSIRITDAAGSVKASTVNGSVNLDFNPNAAIKDIHASTVNGSISAGLPKSFAGTVKLNTVNGSIHTDAAITVKGEIGKKGIEGVIGSGDGHLELSTVNGSIKLR
jgi:hypothetical protein